MTKKRFQGTGTALVTPFKRDGSIDEAALRRLVDFQIEAGIDMLLPCGTTGEGATLDAAETEQVVRVVIDQAKGRVPVIVGAGSNSTAKAILQTKSARKLGAAGVLSVGPYYNKPTQQGFYEHFKAIAEAEDIPIIVYNVPGRTSSNIEAKTMLRLAEVPNIVAVKEASGNFGQIMDILRDRPPDFRVLSGDDAIALAIVAMGGDGIVSVVSNEAPKMMREIIDAGLAGEFQRAREIHYRLLPLMNINFIESNPIPVKAAMAMMGLIEEVYRLPLVPITSGGREKLRQVVEQLGLLEVAGGASLSLQTDIERLLGLSAEEARREGMAVIQEFRSGLNRGEFRAAQKDGSQWRVNLWVKRGILLAFRIGAIVDRSIPGEFFFFDKDSLPPHSLTTSDGVRVVPGGSSIRDGAFIGRNVICMPPMFINVGAYVDEGTMVDSHALVGSCAQIGKRVHLSAAAQVGGVLEPPGALPVIIEDDAFIGGNCGVYEGVWIRERAVLAPGVILTAGTTVFDLVRSEIYRRTPEHPLTIPPGAVVVPGSRKASGSFAEQHQLSLYAPVIVKYRDEKTNASTMLEEALR